jgi:Ca2+-binding EF-hand superfamily protein
MQERGDPEKFVEAQFKAHDKNKNGKMERAESQLPAEIFKRIDKNGDKAITKKEALEAHRERMEKRSKSHESRAKNRARPEKEHGKRNGSPFARIDASGDGKITEAEVKGAADRVFSRFDQNKDNVITRAEISQSHQRHHSADCEKGREKKQK